VVQGQRANGERQGGRNEGPCPKRGAANRRRALRWPISYNGYVAILALPKRNLATCERVAGGTSPLRSELFCDRSFPLAWMIPCEQVQAAEVTPASPYTVGRSARRSPHRRLSTSSPRPCAAPLSPLAELQYRVRTIAVTALAAEDSAASPAIAFPAFLHRFTPHRCTFPPALAHARWLKSTCAPVHKFTRDTTDDTRPQPPR
jgi:hypothetical protein